MNTQDKEIQQKREEAMKRFMAAKKRKQQRIAELEKMLRQDFRTRTGQEPTSVNVWQYAFSFFEINQQGVTLFGGNGFKP